MTNESILFSLKEKKKKKKKKINKEIEWDEKNGYINKYEKYKII
jgi:hypothetical protein